MAIRGQITLECDRPACHAELVIEAEDVDIEEGISGDGLELYLYAADWRMDTEDGTLWCPQCIEAAERNADGPQDDGASVGHPADALAARMED